MRNPPYSAQKAGSCCGVDEIAEERGPDFDIITVNFDGFGAASVVGIPFGIRFCVIGDSGPYKLIGIECVRDILIIQRGLDEAVLEDVPVRGRDDQAIHLLLLDGGDAVGNFLHSLGGRIGTKHNLSGLQIPIGRAVLGLDDTRFDDVGHEAARGDEVGHDLAVSGDGGFIRAIVAIAGKAQAAHIPTPYIDRFSDGRSIQNQQFVGLARSGIGVNDHITASLPGDESRGVFDGRVHQYWEAVNFRRSMGYFKTHSKAPLRSSVTSQEIQSFRTPMPKVVKSVAFAL